MGMQITNVLQERAGKLAGLLRVTLHTTPGQAQVKAVSERRDGNKARVFRRDIKVDGLRVSTWVVVVRERPER